jgi:hypothetical protein
VSIYLQGHTATLYVQWREYAPDGPFVNVTGVAVTITPLSGGAAVVGPTSVGVSNPVVGTNVYNWAVPANQTAGDYLVSWSGTDPGTGDPVTASEIITVATAASAGSPTGLCEPWPVIWCANLPTGSEAVTGTALQAASEALWAATAQRFGLCTENIRPCRRDCGGGWPYGDSWYEWTGGTWPQPMLYDGAWFNITCGSCSGECSCVGLEEAMLPGPVYDIVQVKVDGVPLPTSAYRLDKGRLLVRTDGGVWPSCQHMERDDTEVGTWSVTARFGERVPILGQQAVGELACEMVRAILGEDCRLPKNVQQLVRQGVTISFPEDSNLVDRLYFGGMFIRAFNPSGLVARPQVYDVDGPTFRHTGS